MLWQISSGGASFRQRLPNDIRPNSGQLVQVNKNETTSAGWLSHPISDLLNSSVSLEYSNNVQTCVRGFIKIINDIKDFLCPFFNKVGHFQFALTVSIPTMLFRGHEAGIVKRAGWGY